MGSAASAYVIGFGGWYCSTAYLYNLNRFQFDANQRQNSAHQAQNMRVSQWGLFREDVRDLFSLTANTGSTYMVVSTLIVSCAMNFIWNGYKDYPMDLPCLVVIWNITVFSCILFGLVSVWLAMHGVVSSNSACTRILTQAVRPPIPTFSQIARVRTAQDNFERSGPGTYFQLPAFLRLWEYLFGHKDEIGGGIRQRASRLFSRKKTNERIPRVRVSLDQQQRDRRTGSLDDSDHQPIAQAGPSGRLKRRGTMLPMDQMANGNQQNRVRDLLNDEDGGPGRSAASHSHFWLLRQVQRSYACFDAYSRICLCVAAHQLLLACGYYALGHFMSKTGPTHNADAAWMAVGAAVVGSIVLIRLDLFVDTRRMYIVQAGLIAGPLCTCLAVTTSDIRTNHGQGGLTPDEQWIPSWMPWLFSMLACCCHIAWTFVMADIAQPTCGSSGLPLLFRSAQYLDVFVASSHTLNDEGGAFGSNSPAVGSDAEANHLASDGSDAEMHDTPKSQRLESALNQASRLVRTITRLTDQKCAKHLTPTELKQLKVLQRKARGQQDSLTEALTGKSLPVREKRKSGQWFFARQATPEDQTLARQESSEPQGNEVYWLQCEYPSDSGGGSYWVSTATGEQIERPPTEGLIIDLSMIATSVRVLQNRVMEGTTPTSSASSRSWKTPSFFRNASPGNDMERERQSTGQLDVSLFEFMPERPDTCASSVSLPWKSFYIACRVIAGMWSITTVVIAFNPKYYESPLAPRDAYSRQLTQVDAAFPHEYFRPSSLTCTLEGDQMILGDSFDIFTADVSIKHYDDIELKRSSLAKAASSPWKSMASLSEAKSLLLLEENGKALLEVPRSKSGKKQRWLLSDMLDAKLLVISASEGDAADFCKEVEGSANVGWSVYAATHFGAVVALCPMDGFLLKPMHIVTTVDRRVPVTSDFMEVIDTATGARHYSDTAVGLHVGNGIVWLIEATVQGAKMRAFGLTGGGELGKWKLPLGRVWARGMCVLKDGQGMLLASSKRNTPSAYPELWHFIPDGRVSNMEDSH